MRTWFIDPASLDAPRNRLAEYDVALHVFTESELKEWLWEEVRDLGIERPKFDDYWRERMEGEK